MPTKTPSAVSGFYAGIFLYYDAVNFFMTLGLDGRWRREAARAALALKPARVLDVCCGTGDLSAELLRLSRTPVSVTGLDLNEQMLSKAREKVPGAVFLQGEAGALPFPDAAFDALTISFAARNLSSENSLAGYFTEFRRVLKPGGALVNLETSRPGNRFIRFLFRAHIGLMTGLIKTLLPETNTAYDFLAETIAAFYPPGELSQMIIKAGFSKVEVRPLMFGAIAVHKAIN